jgi:glycine betaine catabolism A
MLESRAVTTFPLNDQEILLRQLHKAAQDHVDAHLAGSEQPVTISAAS